MSYPYNLRLPLHFQLLLTAAGALLTQESSDFCLCMNLYVHTHIYTHTRIHSPPVQRHTTATFLTNHLFRSKYLKKFFAKIQKLQKKRAKKRNALELCLLKRWFKWQHTPQGLLLLPYLWGGSETQFCVASMLKYPHILKPQWHPCLSSVIRPTVPFQETHGERRCFSLPWLFITQFSGTPELKGPLLWN